MKLRLLPLLLATVASAWAQESPTSPVEKGQAIFASHHSYFQPVTPTLVEIAKAGGYPDQTIVGNDMIGGSKSLYHWTPPDDKNPTKTALKTGKVDVLILTPVYLPDDGIDKFAKFGLESNPNLRVTVMEFWIPYDVYNPQFYDGGYKPVAGEPTLLPKPAKVDHNAATIESLRKIHEYYFQTMDNKIAALNKELGKQAVFVVPMGQAVLELRENVIAGKAPGIATQEELFTDGLGHPGPAMVALEAYCHYAVIYRKSSVGLPVPAILKNSKIPAAQQEALNRLLQEIAWNAVTHHPLSGVKG